MGTRPSLVFPWITAVLCVACTAAYAIAASGLPLPAVTGDAEVHLADPLHIVGLGARSTPLVADADEAWRLLTCHFVHTSLLHLVFNLAFLFSVGGAIEQVVRRSDFAALVLFTAVASAVGSLLGTPQVSAGASGMVFGTLGGAVTLGLRHHARLGQRVRRYFGLWVLPFLLVLFGFGVGNPSVDQASHLGGLLAGLLGGAVVELRSPATGASHRPVALAGAIGLTILAVLSAPLLARGGHPPQRVTLESGATIEIPGTWQSRFGVLGELEYYTAGGMVVLTTDRTQAHAQVNQVNPEFGCGRAFESRGWYEDKRLRPLLPSGRVDGLRCVAVEPLATQGHEVTHVRYALRRHDTPMIRDVYFVAATSREPWTTVLTIETPLTWVDKYANTRDAILQSFRSSLVGGRPPVSVAAMNKSRAGVR